MVGSRTLALRKSWVGAYYHSTRLIPLTLGVSASWSISRLGLLDLHLDPDGRYVALHAMCDRLELLIVGIYIPPPATVDILKKLALIIAQYPSAGVILTGDFNMTPNSALVRDPLVYPPYHNGQTIMGLMMCGE